MVVTVRANTKGVIEFALESRNLFGRLFIVAVNGENNLAQNGVLFSSGPVQRGDPVEHNSLCGAGRLVSVGPSCLTYTAYNMKP